MFRTVPTLAVMALLGGLAWAGHHSGWKLPTLAALNGTTQAPATDWCVEHNVPESACVECQPDLLPSGKGYPWCKRHGLPECVLCHPELAQLKSAPVVTPEMLERARLALEFTERAENSGQCQLHKKRIQFASQAAVDKAGIEIAPAWEASITESVSAIGEIRYDETRLAHLASRVAGTPWKSDRQIGDRVARGDVLALIDSAEIGKVKSEFLQSLAQEQLRKKLVDSMRPSFESGAIPEAKFRETEATWQEALIRLTAAEQMLVNLGMPLRVADMRGLPAAEAFRRARLLGIPADLIGPLEAETTTATLFPLKSPLDGVIIQRHVVIGEAVEATRTLFTVADLSRMWLSLELRMEDARLVKQGQSVKFRPDGSRNELAGTISWISTSVDEKTRTVGVRADLDNSEGKLRAGTFGQGQVILRQEPRAITVPNEAVQWEGDCHVVFVRDKDFLKDDALKVFHVRKVRVGAKDNDKTEIIAGVLPGEIVATTGSAILRAQLLKSNLGAGCGCHH